MANNLGNKITNLMHKNDLSYRDLEEKTGIPKSALHRYASGTTESVPLDRIKLLADAFGVSPAFLSGWEEENTEKNIYGDHQANLDYFADKPEVLEMYKEIYENENLMLLFDTARELKPKELEKVLRYMKLVMEEEL